MLLGRDRTILEANDLFDCRFGAEADPRGRPCFEVTHGRRYRCEACGERCPLATPGEPQIHEHVASRPGDCDAVVARPVRDAHGDVVAFLVVSRPMGFAYSK